MYNNNRYGRSSGGYSRSGGSSPRGGYGNRGYGDYGGRRDQDSRQSAPAEPYKPLADDSYIDEAEKVIKKLQGDDGKSKLTTSKIRNLLAMSAEILNKVNNALGGGQETSSPVSDEIKKEIGYLRVRTVYECGREQNVREFADHSHILDCLRDVKTLGDAERFCHYMEALVAFHRYYGGKD
jgi:CRISPR-associated protein Csm2